MQGIESLFAVVGAAFGVLAALIAFLVTYNEYRKHHFSGWRLWRESLAAALFTFAVFFVLGLALGFLLPRIV